MIDTVDNNKKKLLKAYEKSLCNISQTCKIVGICREAFYQWKRKDPKFDKELKKIKKQLIDDLETQLIEMGRNDNITALIFFLKNNHPNYKPTLYTYGDYKHKVNIQDKPETIEEAKASIRRNYEAMQQIEKREREAAPFIRDSISKPLPQTKNS